MTGWADVGLVAIGGATTLLGGQLEARRAVARDRSARQEASRENARQRELEQLVSLQEALADIWPQSMVHAHRRKPTNAEIAEYAAWIGRVKAASLRIRDDDLRTQVRDCVHGIGKVSLGDHELTDERLTELSDLLEAAANAVADRIRAVEWTLP